MLQQDQPVECSEWVAILQYGRAVEPGTAHTESEVHDCGGILDI